jgi:tRNA (mo5U34)-methyltransferase
MNSDSTECGPAGTPGSIREARKRLDRSAELKAKGWFHSFLLPDGARIEGIQSLEFLHERLARFPLPEDMSGKRVLDIGAWDGWFSFELERRGAQVTAVDCVEVKGFLEIRERLRSQVDYRILDVYELPAANLGTFDCVLFLSILYHLKHPLLALEIVCALARDLAIIESFVTDADKWPSNRDQIPSMEFYETDELGGQLDNWIGPSVSCLLAMCRAAGFARVELVEASGNTAAVVCYRQWEPQPEAAGEPAPVLEAVEHSRNYGINFCTSREEYMSWWFRTAAAQLSRQGLRLEVDGLGVPALYVGRVEGDLWQANSRLPPGLISGWKAARLRTVHSHFSNCMNIAVNLQPVAEELSITSVLDGISWEEGAITLRPDGVVTCFVRGLGANSDRNNVGVFLADRRLEVSYVGASGRSGLHQVNASVEGPVPKGSYPLAVTFGGATSPPVLIEVR